MVVMLSFGTSLYPIVLAVTIVLVSQPGIASAQSQKPKPHELLDDFIEAIGSHMAIRSINSIEMEFAVDINEEMHFVLYKGNHTCNYKRPSDDNQKLETHYKAGYDGKEWFTWTESNRTQVVKDSIEISRNTFSYLSPFDALRIRNEIGQQSDVYRSQYNSTRCWTLVVEYDNGYSSDLIFDAETKLLAAIETHFSYGPVLTEFTYEEVDGIQTIKTIKITPQIDPDATYSCKRTKVKYNHSVDEKMLKWMESASSNK